MPQPSADVIIIGAGLSGLSCALAVKKAGLTPMVFEASSRVGGRVTTDTIDGYRIDRGFQILLTAYPEILHSLDLDTLELGYFNKGAHVLDSDRWHTFYDPRQKPLKCLPSIAKQSIFTGKDLFILAKFWLSIFRIQNTDTLLGSENRRTSAALEQMGFSSHSLELFFKPFLGGVFLDPELHTSEKMFRFVLKMFASGQAALPTNGMKEIPEQLAVQLGIEHISCETSIEHCNFTNGTIRTNHGDTYHAPALVVATDAHQAHALAPDWIPSIPFNHTRSFAFGMSKNDAPEALDATLKLIADKRSPIQVIAATSQVVPEYAPPDHESIMVTLKKGLESEHTPDDVVDALEKVFGKRVKSWNLLMEHRIPHALPRQLPTDLKNIAHFTKIGYRGWACGDYLDTRSINGAMASGRLLGEHIATTRVQS